MPEGISRRSTISTWRPAASYDGGETGVVCGDAGDLFAPSDSPSGPIVFSFSSFNPNVNFESGLPAALPESRGIARCSCVITMGW